ncbi:MAG: bifunctional phosphoribosyl-AMP cyclohydrolase/phosphoribosyl-ATP diphosphatase HisIE [Candidatus Melainabacteria bacterium]|nr:bifunctional phosphoribosyl-AMP cyclohydrolase/phosphoribosyl-ATP diphosphatase HisIE [Candidatus Melainabacteria bacterium]
MLVPSIDIMNGRAVQLRQGKEFVLESEVSPLELARRFNRYGEVAVIDLDAAMGKGSNLALIEEICGVADVRVGGGIRDKETAMALIKAGAQRLIVGTRAEPEFLSQLPAEKVMVALDHRMEVVVDQGWANSTGETIWQRAERLAPYCSGFLATFVEDEGCLKGMNLDAVKALSQRLSGRLTVAGGIKDTAQIAAISRLGLDVQVGMALYKGLVDPIEAVLESLNFSGVKSGDQELIPTVVQDQAGQVLMLAYSSRESLRLALTEGRGVYFSRSRQSLWRKGETSGHVQELLSCRTDCDRDSLLFTVRQVEAACHNDTYSCFAGAGADRKFSLAALFATLESRKAEATEGSYTARLFQNRKLLLKKIMEEAFEVSTYEDRANLRWEIADLIYFLSVLAVDEGLNWKDIENELAARRR